MYKETNIRSVIKGVSWRILASLTTMIIVYIIFGNIELALATGFVEIIAKIILYWIHERIWQKIKWGRKKIEPFNIWFTGLPLSGKTTIADMVYKDLKKRDIPVERIDSKDVRVLIPDIGFEREDRIRHLTRIAHLVSVLQKNSISTVCSFVSPYEEARQKIKQITRNTVIVYLKADIETCRKRDYKGVYEKALKGEIKNFTGISDIYEEPENPELIIDTRKTPPEEAAKIIVNYTIKNCLRWENG